MAVSDPLGLAAREKNIRPATCFENCCPCCAEVRLVVNPASPSSSLDLVYGSSSTVSGVSFSLTTVAATVLGGLMLVGVGVVVLMRASVA